MAENGELPQIEPPNAHDTIHEQVRRDAIFPSERQTKVSDWKRFIRRGIPDFNGDINSAAKLMFAYQRGSEYIYNKFSPRFGDFKRPDIMVLLNEAGADSSFASVRGENKILVKKSFLERFSDLETASLTKWKRQTGEIVFEGYPIDLFLLEGIEETHHQLFSQIKTDPESKSPDLVTLDGYDSQETEFRALRWQLQYAVENKFPTETIRVLRDRIDRAQEIRLRQKVGQ